MAGPLYHLGRACSRHHWLVIACWVLAAVGLALVARGIGDKTSDNLSLPGTESTAAQDLLRTHLPERAYGANPLALRAGSGKLTDAQNKQAVDATVSNLGRTPGVTSAVNPLGSQGAAFLSRDATIAYVPVTLDISPADLTKEQAQAVLDAADPARDAGIEVAVGGYVGQQLSKPDTESSEVVGLAAAVLILLFAFGTATAMALPIVTAVLGLACALAIIQLLGNVFDVPSIAPTLGTMIGLGVGIDYALFVVTRHKLQLKSGMEMEESIARATATAGGAVLFAGGTVVIALCSLAVADIPLVRNMGFAAAVSVIVAVAGALTLLPALLGALGPRINSLRVQLGRTHPDDQHPHGWARWAQAVSRRPVPAAIVGAIVLLVLAIPVLDLNLGQADNGELPTDTTARQAYDIVSEGFGSGTTGPLLVSVRLGSAAKPAASGEPATTDPRLTKLTKAVSDTAGVQSVSPVTLSSQGTAGVFTVISASAPSSAQTEDLVRNLRDDVIPGALAGTDVQANVGGQTAAYIDLADRISEKLPLMIAVVVALSFVVLMLAFRSLLVPLKAAVMNLLSVAAAYGIVTFIFQQGHGASLIGLEGATPIVSFVPLMMFAILFGLSMDYEVFLLSQIQDHYKHEGRPTKAVIDGLATTGRVITSAALIMVCVFTSFVLSGDPTVKQFGIGLAVAIAIDATLVRCVLVPAVMVMLGRRAWWLPSWLDRWLPHLSIEGEEYFAKRDADAKVAVPAGS